MKKKLYVYIDPINIKFPGFSIIANRMVRYIPNCEIIDNLSKCNKSDWILPDCCRVEFIEGRGTL